MLPALFGAQLAMDYMQKQKERKRAANEAAAGVQMQNAQRLGASSAPYQAAKLQNQMDEDRQRDRSEMFQRLFGYLNKGS